MSEPVSLALRRWAKDAPERLALRTFGPRAVTLRFAELEQRVDACAHALAGFGLTRGERAALFVPPGVDFVALFHALLRLGALPILIDPGMGRRALFECVARAAPSALIGVPRVHLARQLFPRAFRSVGLSVSVGRGFAFGARRLEPALRAGPAFPHAEVEPDSPAAVLFTSGSTGPAKGAVHTHANFAAELELLREHFVLVPGEVDCACFPLFALFDNALGLTSVFPELDPRRPARCDPSKIVHAIETSGATFSFGSPAIWRRVVPWMRAARRRFTTLTRVTLAGAPIPPSLVLALEELLALGGTVHTPYGATEALPVSDITARELAPLAESIEAGDGNCIGRPLAAVAVALIRVTDEPIARWDPSLEVPPGEPGEVCVRGAMVTPRYLDDARATALAKIRDGDAVWHRMGDIARQDAAGRLWFLGRKSERLETARGVLYPVPLENAFNSTRGVARTALVGIGARGAERAILVVEPTAGREELLPRLRARAAAVPAATAIEDFLIHPHFPVDVRHNAKIRRAELKHWAATRLRP
jgi:acyl-CoA synthetase (AMP-forming)/AMP-acid ligase II